MRKQLYFTKNQFMNLYGIDMICHAGQIYEVENKQAEVLLDHKIALEVENDKKSVIHSTFATTHNGRSKKLPKSGRKSGGLKD